MRQLITTIAILISGISIGQQFSYPVIKTHGKNINSFIPEGWALLDSTNGDLNSDKQSDIVLIIQHKDSVQLIKKELDYEDTVTTQPRMLIIAFYNPLTKSYDLTEQSNRFILNYDNPTMEDPYVDISIKKCILKIDFQIFYNMGSWSTSNNSYMFRYQNKEFLLVGSDYFSVQRNTGEIENRSYNFLTKKVKIESGNLAIQKQSVKWRKFKLRELKTLKTFTQPFSWEIEKDFYL